MGLIVGKYRMECTKNRINPFRKVQESPYFPINRYKMCKDKIEKFKIVGSSEADPAEGKISDDSPIGKAALRKKAGDIFTVDAPVGELKFEIISISK